MPTYGLPYEVEREKLVREMLPKGAGIAVDIGCSDGRFTGLLPAAGYARAVGYDTNAEVLRSARATYPAIDFRDGYDDFSVKDRSLTVALELIEHIPPALHMGFLRSVRESTAPGGRLFRSTPSRYSLLASYERLRGLKGERLEPYSWWDPTHVSVLPFGRLMRLLKAANFEVEERAGFCFAPPSLVKPSSSRGPLLRFGFDVLVVARAA